MLKHCLTPFNHLHRKHKHTHGTFRRLNRSFCFDTIRKAESHKFYLMLELTILTIFRANNNIKNLFNLIV